MIDPATYSLSHFEAMKGATKADSGIIERSIFALGLVEALSKTGCHFVFKGGSSLMLLLDSPKRLSTDVDILVDPDCPIDAHIEKAATIFPFKREDESIRKTNKNITKRHFSFYFDSVVRPGHEFRILLDVLFAGNPYDELTEKEIRSEILFAQARTSRFASLPRTPSWEISSPPSLRIPLEFAITMKIFRTTSD